MAVGDQYHGGVSTPVPARLAGRLHQLLDLEPGEDRSRTKSNNLLPPLWQMQMRACAG